MNLTRNALLAGLAVAALGLSATASAHDRHDRYERHHWKQGHHSYGHARHYERHVARHYYAPPPYVVRERVVVQRPIYVAPPPRYYAPAYPPGLVVSVDIPPIVIPIR
jgi:hypothetical protein